MPGLAKLPGRVFLFRQAAVRQSNRCPKVFAVFFRCLFLAIEMLPVSAAIFDMNTLKHSVSGNFFTF